MTAYTMRNLFAALICAVVLPMACRPAYAIRPFVTDDARVVGGRQAQVETWLQGKDEQLAHNVLGALGPIDWLEITTGFVHGGDYSRDGGYSIVGPLFQLKALASESRSSGLPGVAFAAGVVPTVGEGVFKHEGAATFAYMALTQTLYNEDLLLHFNFGVASADERRHWTTTATGGFGFQARLLGGLHGVGEVYYGDPYDPVPARPESQLGFRYILSDTVQFDGTVGKAMDGNDRHWWTLGIRLVSPSLW